MDIEETSSEEKGWHDALPRADLPPGTTAELVLGDAIIALANVEGVVHAFDGLCSHQGGPLGKGKLEGCTLTCPWHGWQYDVTTGRQVLSKTIRQRLYTVRMKGDMIQVKLKSPSPFRGRG